MPSVLGFRHSHSLSTPVMKLATWIKVERCMASWRPTNNVSVEVSYTAADCKVKEEHTRMMGMALHARACQDYPQPGSALRQQPPRHTWALIHPSVWKWKVSCNIHGRG